MRRMTSFLGGIFIIEWYKYRKINYALTSIYSLKDYKTIAQNYNWDALEKNSIQLHKLRLNWKMSCIQCQGTL